MWCVAPVAGTYDATACIHPRDRHLLTDPMAGMSPETAAMLLGGDYEFAEPDDVARARRRRRRSSSPASSSSSTTRPGHTEGSVTFRTPYDEPTDVSEVMFSGDLLFAGSIGRTDLPGGDHPTMLRSLRDKVLPLRRRHRGAARPRRADHASAASAPPTRSCSTCRRVADEQLTPMSRPTPLSGFPELLPAAALRRAAGHRPACAATFELHGFANIETRAVEPLDQLLRKGEIDKEVYVLRRLQADDDAGGRRARACTSTSPCRSRATCSRTPASWSSRSGATRSRRRGAASGRRRAATASSPRPTSTSSAATSCRSTTTSRWRG